MSSTMIVPFQLLELNVISAQDLFPASRSMRAYAVAWVHPDRKLSTRVDAHGRNNPTWNDKFVFRVDEDFLFNDTSAVMIEIYALHWFRDVHVGTVRVLVGNLIPPPPTRSYQNPNHVQLGMRFVALQVRRQSGRPQGILNIGVALLDSSMRSMPLCTQLSSAVGYRHLMGEDDVFHSNNQTIVSNNQNSLTFFSKPELRRTKSDSSSMVGTEMVKKPKGEAAAAAARSTKTFSMISGSELEPPEPSQNFKIFNKHLRSSKASSIYSGSDFIRKPKGGSAVGYDAARSQPQNKGIIVKPDALINGSEIIDPPKKGKIEKASSVVSGSDIDPPKKVNSLIPLPANQSPNKTRKQNGLSPYRHENEAQVKFKKYRGPLLTESELGPSPSEVAAVKAKELLMKRAAKDADQESSVMMAGWDMDSSVEGLQSKLERWRAELPPLYDSSFPSSSYGGGGGTTGGKHSRRHTDGGASSPGLFSCFSNICGCECSIVCGGGNSGSPARKSKRKGGQSTRLIRSPSISSSFL